MRKRVYWKIAVTYLVAAGVVLCPLSVYITVAVENWTRTAVHEDIEARAVLAREAVRQWMNTHPDGTDLKQMTTKLAAETDCRVTLIAADGRVLADSEHEPATMDNHHTRPEVLAAKREGIGRVTRRSDTLGTELYYVALPMDLNAHRGSVIRLSVPLTQVSAAGWQVRRITLAGLVLAVGLVILLSLWLARGIVRPLGEVERAAVAFAEGDLTQRARVDTGDEFQRLAETFNGVADRLEATLLELQAAKAHNEAVLANMADGVIVTDAEGIVTLFNRACEDLLGVRADDAVGRTVHEACLQFEIGEMAAQCLATGVAERREVQVERPAVRVLDVAATAIDGHGRPPVGVVIVLHDLTQLRRLENVRREFIGNVSHELRTPVAAVRSLVETLASAATDDPDAARRFLRELQDQTERLTALLDDLLELACLDAGRREMARDVVVLEDVMGASMEKLSIAAKQKGQRMHAQIPKDLIVRGDAQALERVMVNLLDNAVKYTHQGGQITVTATEEGDMTRIEVADSGPGIPEADQSRVFERFYRADRARSRTLGGTGLGLSIVKHIVELHGGQVGVTSTVGEGSTFWVRLPRVKNPNETA